MSLEFASASAKGRPGRRSEKFGVFAKRNRKALLLAV